MTPKTSQNASQISSKPASVAQPDVAALLARIADLTAETLAHPQVVNKTEHGVASRVARVLNKEGQFTCQAHRFWTYSHVLAYVAKNSK